MSETVSHVSDSANQGQKGKRVVAIMYFGKSSFTSSPLCVARVSKDSTIHVTVDKEEILISYLNSTE